MVGTQGYDLIGVAIGKPQPRVIRKPLPPKPVAANPLMIV
jgi:hypothetical protein